MDTLNLYILTFNCARNLVDVDRFAHHFFDSLPLTDNLNPSSSSPPPDLIVLSLQEIAPIAYAFLGGSFLTPYFAALTQVVNRAVAQRWDDVHYVNIVTDNSGMTGLMVFARSDVAEQVARLETARIGFGFQEMGNKGAVGARLGYLPSSRREEDSGEGAPQPVELTFVATHLAPMEWAVERRNADWRSLVERLVFERQDGRVAVGDTGAAGQGPGGTDDEDGSERTPLLPRDSTPASPVGQQQQPDSRRGIYVPTSYLFLAGDLNYRTADRPPHPGDRTSRFPRVNVETSDPRHYSHLLEEDQLSREMGQSRCFQGLSEAPISFPPTYKYSLAARHAVSKAVGDHALSQDWQWTGTRWPSWCDRVLYLDQPGQPVQPLRYDALPLFPTSDHRAVALAVSVPARPTRQADTLAQLPAAPFPIDPDWARRRDAARRKELVVGCVAYLGLTWEGNGVLVAMVVGLCGAWLVLRSLLNA